MLPHEEERPGAVDKLPGASGMRSLGQQPTRLVVYLWAAQMTGHCNKLPFSKAVEEGMEV